MAKSKWYQWVFNPVRSILRLFDKKVNEGAGTSVFDKITGAHLTGAQEESNAFNANEAQKQRDFEQQMSDTSFQRQVADLQSAGLNPALAMSSGGASTPSGASASSVSPESGSSLGEVLQLLSFRKDYEKTQAEINNINADTENKDADTRNIQEHTSLLGPEFDLKVQSLGLEERKVYLEEVKTQITKDLTDAEIEKMRVEMRSLEQHIKESMQNVKESVSRVALNAANAALSRADASQIYELLPYVKSLKDAQTQEAWKQSAWLGVQTAYQNGLIDAGYIDEMVRKVANEADIAGYEANSANVDQLLDKLHYAMRTGQYFEGDGAASKVMNGVVRGFATFTDQFSPLTSIASASVISSARR